MLANRWSNLDLQSRNETKQVFYNALSFSNLQISSIAAQTLGSIFLLENSDEELGGLFANTRNLLQSFADGSLKTSCMQLVTFLCEELPPAKLAGFSGDITQAVISGLNLQNNRYCLFFFRATIRAGLEAFLASISLFESLFLEARYGMPLISTLLCIPTRPEFEAEVCLICYEILVRFCRDFYSLLGLYFPSVFPVFVLYEN